MKLFFLLSFVLCAVVAFAQPKVITQATVYTSTNVIAPEDEDVSQIQNQGGGGFNFRTMFDGETKSTTYIKNDLVKTTLKSETFHANIYRDNAAKITTNVFEVMGTKQAIRSSDQEQVDMRNKMDSMMKERAKTDTSFHYKPRNTRTAGPTIAYTEETKKIAGYNCKKAYLITDHILSKDSLVIWYTPDIKFPNVPSTGGTSGIGGGMNAGGPNFDDVNGFVMQYTRNIQNGRKMEVKVTKIDIGDVADKEFEIPKDIEIKSMKDMQNGGGFGRFGRP